MSFIINNQEVFQTNSSIYILIQGMSMVYFVFKKVHSGLAQKFSMIYHLVWKSSRMTRQNKAALRKYQHTHSFYSVDEFFMFEDDLLYFWKMSLSILHSKFVYLWLVPHPTVFMTQFWICGISIYICVCVHKFLSFVVPNIFNKLW